MGLYDTVKFRCPSCKSLQYIQTKSGPCNLVTYTLESAPARILIDLDEEEVECTYCQKYISFSVKSIIIATPYISSEEID